MTRGPTISRQLNCDATMNTAPAFVSSLCSVRTSAGPMFVKAMPEPGFPLRTASSLCSSSATDGVSNGPTWKLLPVVVVVRTIGAAGMSAGRTVCEASAAASATRN